MQFNLTTSRNSVLSVESVDATVYDHFREPNNYTDILLNQLTELPYGFINGENLVGIDVGANVGLFSLHIQDRCRKLLSLEPTPSHFAVLSSLVKEYRNIYPIRLALSDHDGEVEFHTYGPNSTMNSTKTLFTKDEPTTKTFKVPCRTISSLIRTYNLDKVDFVKVDIEGAELSVLTDEQIRSVKNIVRGWYVECHQTDLIYARPGDDMNKIRNAHLHENRTKLGYRLRQLGYTVENIRHDAVWAFK